MKVNFKETIHLRTEQDLQRISKDTVFYSGEERLLALEELEKRGSIQKESAEMKEHIIGSTVQYTPLESTPAHRIYKTNMIWVGSYLGGPLAAGYILAANFKAFGEQERARKTWIYTIVATIAILAGVFVIPEKVLETIPNLAIPILYTVAAYFLMQHYQDHNIGTHLVSGGGVFSWWRVVAIGLIGLAATLAAVKLVSLILFSLILINDLQLH